MSTDITNSTLPNKTCRDLAKDLLGRFPDIDRSALLEDMVAHYFLEMRHGNKREERAACDFLNSLQHHAAVLARTSHEHHPCD